MNVFVKHDTKGKIRVAQFDYEWSDEQHAFLIRRCTGLYGGKLTQQPDKVITKGKASRTISEQVKLEYAHLLKECKDKGYKELEMPLDTYTEAELHSLIGSDTTSADGVVKPMLAKQADSIPESKRNIFNNKFYISRKIDGLRCLLYLGKDGKIHTKARGATNYDPAMIEIITHPTLVKLFQKNPWLIMDGECYRHGMTLQQINGVARTQKTAVDYSVLQFYWYDIVDTNRTFPDRLARMLAIKQALKLDFDPDRTFEDGDLRIQFVPQEEISGWDNIIKAHNQYVAEGFEGAVIRDITSTYNPGGRTNSMIKVKQYKDAEFEIIGYELGLRGTEDMCFRCITDEGKEFLAKPHGDRALKQWYIDNFETECKNKMANVKYFYMSDDNIPLQPSVKCVRLEGDYE